MLSADQKRLAGKWEWLALGAATEINYSGTFTNREVQSLRNFSLYLVLSSTHCIIMTLFNIRDANYSVVMAIVFFSWQRSEGCILQQCQKTKRDSVSVCDGGKWDLRIIHLYSKCNTGSVTFKIFYVPLLALEYSLLRITKTHPGEKMLQERRISFGGCRVLLTGETCPI